ncbi:hypothetical protein MHU86_11321 [Fragilaria crotonensis]|nr:hypothetical protein MHU86_11321 [Fragilaria crotonensis]
MYLQVDAPSIPKLQRRYDHHLMDAILDSHKFTDAEIRRLNYCRLYLKAVTLADISSINGKYLDKPKWTGESSLVASTTHGNVIYQERPSDQEWTLWRRMCKTLWSDKEGKLREPLGHWTQPTPSQRQQHHAYLEHEALCGSDTILWVRINSEEYTRCIQTESPWVYRETTQCRAWKDLPPHASPSNVDLRAPNLWNLVYRAATDFSTNNVQPVATFEAFVNSLPSWEAELLQHVDMSEDAFTVSEVLSHGIQAVSDGSVWTDNQGAYGWMISSDLGDRAVRGMGPARGAKVDSYRAEAYGMLAILCYLRRLAEFTTQTEPWTGILATDSQSLLESITVPPSPQDEPACGTMYSTLKQVKHLDVKCPEWDLLSSVLTELQRWPGITLQHVRGHQDRKVAYARLPLLAQLNVDADLMATTYQCEQGMSRPIVLLTDTAGVHLVTPNGSMTKNYESAIRYQATKPGLAKHIQERYGWSASVMNNVNWRAHGSSLRKQIKRKTHYTKLVHEILPTGKNVHRRDPPKPVPAMSCSCGRLVSYTPMSPRESRDLASSSDTKVDERCEALRTRPLLKTVLRDALTGWLQSDTDEYQLNPQQYPKDVHRLIRQQNDIGWQQLFLGRFSNEWSDIQENYYAKTAAETAPAAKKTAKQTGLRWQVAIIGIIWEQWWALWEIRNKDLIFPALIASEASYQRPASVWSKTLSVEPAAFHYSKAEDLLYVLGHNPERIVSLKPEDGSIVEEIDLGSVTGLSSVRNVAIRESENRLDYAILTVETGIAGSDGSSDNRLVCWDFSSSKSAWEFNVTSFGMSLPTSGNAAWSDDGQVFYQHFAQGEVYAFNIRSGEVLWKKKFLPMAGWTYLNGFLYGGILAEVGGESISPGIYQITAQYGDYVNFYRTPNLCFAQGSTFLAPSGRATSQRTAGTNCNNIWSNAVSSKSGEFLYFMDDLFGLMKLNASDISSGPIWSNAFARDNSGKSQQTYFSPVIDASSGAVEFATDPSLLSTFVTFNDGANLFFTAGGDSVQAYESKIVAPAIVTNGANGSTSSGTPLRWGMAAALVAAAVGVGI